ncbi:hypothetical protein SBA4_4470006 [Candidatus Sulfopaludibacter sp. SbA4]|nr:hypothetical protein SBA4_4470006 [Candidatus Sulfopaludibacter sp. SbA4]
MKVTCISACRLITPPGRSPTTAGYSRLRRRAKPVQLFDVGARRKLAELEHPVGGTNAIAFSRDGKRLATVDGDTVVRIYEAAGGKLLAANDDSLNEPLAIEFSGDGKHALIGGGDKANRLRRHGHRQDRAPHGSHCRASQRSAGLAQGRSAGSRVHEGGQYAGAGPHRGLGSGLRAAAGGMDAAETRCGRRLD